MPVHLSACLSVYICMYVHFDVQVLSIATSATSGAVFGPGLLSSMTLTHPGCYLPPGP